MPMEPRQVGSCGQHWCAAVLYLRILLVFLAERGRHDRRKLQLGECHVRRHSRDKCGRLHAAGSSYVQGTRRVFGSMEGEIGQSAPKSNSINATDVLGKCPTN